MCMLDEHERACCAETYGEDACVKIRVVQSKTVHGMFHD